MAIRISNVRLEIEEPEAALPERLAHVLGLSPRDFSSWRILRKSLDARVKERMRFVYSAEVRVPQEETDVVRHALRRGAGDLVIECREEPPFELPPFGARPLSHPPVIIGSGPAGLVAGYF